MDKEDREYLKLLIRERLRGWVEIPPDNVINNIINDLWDEFRVIQEKTKWQAKME